jgi:hypothetical protein
VRRADVQHGWTVRAVGGAAPAHFAVTAAAVDPAAFLDPLVPRCANQLLQARA